MLSPDTKLILQFLLCLTSTIGLVSSNDVTEISSVRCRYSIDHRLYTANCSTMTLFTVPDSLHKDIEVLDLGYNHLRTIQNSTFEGFSKLKLLYLNDNQIKFIHSAAFEHLTTLETLDLQGNAFTTLNINYPKSLIRLYLGSNNIHITKSNFQKATMIQYLSLKKCGLTEIPDMGIFPNLVELNLEVNPLSNITALQLASFCRLSLLHVDEDLFGPETVCDCLRLQHYTKTMNIVVKTLLCSIDNNEPATDICPELTISEETNAQLSACQNEWSSRQISHGIFAGFLFLVVIVGTAVLIILWKKRRDTLNKNKTNANIKEGKSKEPEAKSEPALLA